MPNSRLSALLIDEHRLWFPGLADILVADFMAKDEHRLILTRGYGTQRWLTGNPDGPLQGTGTFRLGRLTTTIEYLPDTTAALFPHLTFADYDPRSASSQLQASADVLTSVEGLADTVGGLVRTIHVVSARRDHDISHSSPDLPFSIFVSLPQVMERDATLRLAESVLHEAMHLQLSLVEISDPMVTEAGSYGYSPWKSQVRPLGGLIHGIYVFAVIHQAFGVVMQSQSVWQPHCQKRRATIEQEVAMLPERPRGLSGVGVELWRRSRETVLENAH